MYISVKISGKPVYKGGFMTIVNVNDAMFDIDEVVAPANSGRIQYRESADRDATVYSLIYPGMYTARAPFPSALVVAISIPEGMALPGGITTRQMLHAMLDSFLSAFARPHQDGYIYDIRGVTPEAIEQIVYGAELVTAPEPVPAPEPEPVPEPVQPSAVPVDTAVQSEPATVQPADVGDEAAEDLPVDDINDIDYTPVSNGGMPTEGSQKNSSSTNKLLVLLVIILVILLIAALYFLLLRPDYFAPQTIEEPYVTEVDTVVMTDTVVVHDTVEVAPKLQVPAVPSTYPTATPASASPSAGGYTPRQQGQSPVPAIDRQLDILTRPVDDQGAQPQSSTTLDPTKERALPTNRQ